jgi:hypothetical protein
MESKSQDYYRQDEEHHRRVGGERGVTHSEHLFFQDEALLLVAQGIVDAVLPASHFLDFLPKIEDGRLGQAQFVAIISQPLFVHLGQSGEKTHAQTQQQPVSQSYR